MRGDILFYKLSFFVILKSNNGELEIRKIQMTQETQHRLIAAFSDGANKILDSKLEKVEFDGNYKPEKGEINVISNYKIDEEIISAIKEPTSINELEAKEDMILKIGSIFCGNISENKKVVCFSNFTKANYITKKGITNIFHNGETFVYVPGPGFNISGEVDVIFYNGELLFWNYWTARQILDLTSYYREATNEDLNDFINHDAVNVADPDTFVMMSDSWVRRKIALLKDSEVLDYCRPSLIAEKAEEYGVEISVTNEKDKEKINIPLEKRELKNVLRFLDEDYFCGPITNAKYLTNSKRKVRK